MDWWFGHSNCAHVDSKVVRVLTIKRDRSLSHPVNYHHFHFKFHHSYHLIDWSFGNCIPEYYNAAKFWTCYNRCHVQNAVGIISPQLGSDHNEIYIKFELWSKYRFRNGPLVMSLIFSVNIAHAKAEKLISLLPISWKNSHLFVIRFCVRHDSNIFAMKIKITYIFYFFAHWLL